ncbi:MAG: hypothetical protein EOP06_14655 [Proteobacteria bacterium]|nr:MAG: hypothetical protein EOP06_14655 [Pseudomonadota bacterium]
MIRIRLIGAVVFLGVVLFFGRSYLGSLPKTDFRGVKPGIRLFASFKSYESQASVLNRIRSTVKVYQEEMRTTHGPSFVITTVSVSDARSKKEFDLTFYNDRLAKVCQSSRAKLEQENLDDSKFRIESVQEVDSATWRSCVKDSRLLDEHNAWVGKYS